MQNTLFLLKYFIKYFAKYQLSIWIFIKTYKIVKPDMQLVLLRI